VAAMPSSASHLGRQAQWVPPTSSEQCGASQCYYSSNTSNYAGCFHITSRECTVLLQDQLLLQDTVTPPPTPNPITQMVQSEIPILLRLLNVPEDYILSPSDRAKILNKMWAVLDEELDDSWEIMSVEFPGQYIGARRLQSSLRGGSTRRLSDMLYIPVVITLRGREIMSGMALDFILQAFRNKLNALLMYIKSLDPDAFRNLQMSELSVEKLDLDDVDEGVRGPTLVIQSTDSNTSTKTETNSSTETTTTISVGTQSTGAASTTSTGPPFWVWLIVAFVVIPLIICLILCMFRAGWCLCCTDWLSCCNRKRDTKEDYELQKQLAIESWKQQPVKKRRDRDPPNDLVNGRDGYESRRERDVRRKHHRRRGDHGRRRHHGDRRHNDRGDHQGDRSRQVKPVAKRSLSMIEKEIALAQLKLIEAGSEAETQYDEPVVAARPVPSYPAYLPTQNQGKDPSVAVGYPNALVVYDDEQIRFTMEPEGSKIEDMPKPTNTAVVLFKPPKEPEGDSIATPRRKSGRYYHHEKDELYVCSPEELPPDVREKTANYYSEKTQHRQRSSRRKRLSYTDRLKESFTFRRASGRGNDDDDDSEDNDGVQATLEPEESDSEEIERREKQRKREERKKRRSKKKKRSNRSSSHKRHDENVPASNDVESGSRPSIATRPPDSDEDNALSKSLISRLSQSPIFSSFRPVQSVQYSNDSDDESVERN